MNTIEEAQAILQAMKEGKTIQFDLEDDGWHEWDPSELPDFCSKRYRVKPEAVTRLLTVDELPDVIWLKNKYGNIFQVIGVCNENQLSVTNESHECGCNIERLHKIGYQWSPSRKGPWKSFETQEEAK